jgi:hypothetical protein
MTIRVAIMVEGDTERAFAPALRKYLETKIPGRMPRLRFSPHNGRVPVGNKLRSEVRLLLRDHDAVIALTDVYTGPRPHDFSDAADAKEKMRTWVDDPSRFYPHAAQYEFEAWLLPYWHRIQQLSGAATARPSLQPEDVNHDKPPSKVISDAFRSGGKRKYVKPRDAGDILLNQDLSIAVAQCGELRAFLDTILRLSGYEALGKG